MVSHQQLLPPISRLPPRYRAHYDSDGVACGHSSTAGVAEHAICLKRQIRRTSPGTTAEGRVRAPAGLLGPVETVEVVRTTGPPSGGRRPAVRAAQEKHESGARARAGSGDVTEPRRRLKRHTPRAISAPHTSFLWRRVRRVGEYSRWRACFQHLLADARDTSTPAGAGTNGEEMGDAT